MKPRLISVVDKNGDEMTFAEVINEACRHKAIKPAPMLRDTVLKERRERRERQASYETPESDNTQQERESALLKGAIFILAAIGSFLIAIAVGSAML